MTFFVPPDLLSYSCGKQQRFSPPPMVLTPKTQGRRSWPAFAQKLGIATGKKGGKKENWQLIYLYLCFLGDFLRIGAGMYFVPRDIKISTWKNLTGISQFVPKNFKVWNQQFLANQPSSFRCYSWWLVHLPPPSLLPPRNTALLRAYEPLVSYQTPYFWGGSIFGGWLISLCLVVGSVRSPLLPPGLSRLLATPASCAPCTAPTPHRGPTLAALVRVVLSMTPCRGEPKKTEIWRGGDGDQMQEMQSVAGSKLFKWFCLSWFKGV